MFRGRAVRHRRLRFLFPFRRPIRLHTFGLGLTLSDSPALTSWSRDFCCGKPTHGLVFALKSTVITHSTRSGKAHPAVGRLSGHAAAGVVSQVALHAGSGAATAGFGLAAEAGLNVAREFWPHHNSERIEASFKKRGTSRLADAPGVFVNHGSGAVLSASSLRPPVN